MTISYSIFSSPDFMSGMSQIQIQYPDIDMDFEYALGITQLGLFKREQENQQALLYIWLEQQRRNYKKSKKTKKIKEINNH